MSGEEAKLRGLAPQVEIVSVGTFAHDPAWFTTAPIGAIKTALAKANLRAEDIDLFEINEAFASVAMVAVEELGLSPEKVNVWGGAIALGHPIGCSGARILTTLISQLIATQGRYGCASLCLGGGEAVAMIVKRSAA
jgi:acetyl-CoA C-acetyltransferase